MLPTENIRGFDVVSGFATVAESVYGMLDPIGRPKDFGAGFTTSGRFRGKFQSRCCPTPILQATDCTYFVRQLQNGGRARQIRNLKASPPRS